MNTDQDFRNRVNAAEDKEAPPKATATPPDLNIDYSDSQVRPCDVYLFHDPEYPIEAYAS